MRDGAGQRRTDRDHVRSTQSLLQIQAQCWRRPGLIARELLWRWLFGLPMLALLVWCGRRLVVVLLAANTGLEDFSFQQPAAAAAIVQQSWAAVAPAAARLAVWVIPVLALGWATASGLGRAWVFGALLPGVRVRAGSLIALQLLRSVSLVSSVLIWLALLRWAAIRDIARLPATAEPDLVAFAAWVICLSLGSFIVWALWSWVLSMASVLVCAKGCGAGAALAMSVRMGRRLTMQLVEVNLVLGIVKLALIVLEMVFSSIPLPFETVMTGRALYVWWAFVAVLYLAASDFFQVARLAAFLDFLRGAPEAELQRIH